MTAAKEAWEAAGTGSLALTEEGQQEGSDTPCGGISGGRGRGSGLASSRGHLGLGVHHVDTPSSLQVDPARREGVSFFLGFGPKTQTKRRLESGSFLRSHVSLPYPLLPASPLEQ